MKYYYNRRGLKHDDIQLECFGLILIFTGSINIYHLFKLKYLEISSFLENLFKRIEKQLFEVVVLRKYAIFAIFTINLKTMLISLRVFFFERVHVALQLLLSRCIVNIHYTFNVLKQIKKCLYLTLTLITVDGFSPYSLA
jgi:hypothetical protein